MISEQDIQRATQTGARFQAGSVEFGDAVVHCTLIVNRQRIDELRALSQTEMETITVSAVGVHIERADVDINSAGLITHISQQLETEVASSF